MAKSASLRSRKRKTDKKKDGFILSLNATGIISFITFCLVLFVAMFLSELTPKLELQKIRDQSIKYQASQYATTMSHEVAAYRYMALAISRDPELRKLILSANKTEIRKKEKYLATLFDGVQKVRLLPTGIRTQDKSSRPHISFACIDMIRSAETSLSAPDIELHVFGTAHEHIDIIQPILTANGRRAIGLLQVTINSSVLKQWLKADDLAGYISLSQPVEGRSGLSLLELGANNKKMGALEMTLPVAGTSWQLSFWGKDTTDSSLFNSNFFITYFVGILMLSLIILVLMRALGRAISMDIETFMKLVASELKGDSNHQFQLNLKEFKLGARQIDSLSTLPTKERERDESTNSMSAGSLKMDMNLDPMYIDEHSMEVEELDDEAYEKLKRKQKLSITATSAPPVSPPKVAEAPAAPPPPMPPAGIFKAYDIRGIVGRTLTAEHMTMIGQALGSEAIERGLKSIAFARDGRLSGPELGQALVKGMLSSGIDVIDVGMVPTPVLYYAAHELSTGSGVMLTGSHNPPDYNGIKMMLGGDTLSGDSIQKLKHRVDNNDYHTGKGQYRNQPVSKQYIERVITDVKPARKLKVVIDSGNGVAGGLAPTLFTELGCEVVELYSEVDGNFPNHHPDPSQPENLRDLIEMVHASNADVGFAFDGDGDRLGVVSANGSIIWPDRLMMLFAADVLKRNPGAQIIYDIKCSNNLTKVIWEKGGEPVMWKTGHSLIKAKMKQSGALLAGEMSGHIFFKERWYGFDDALYSGARLLEILAGDERTPQDVFSSLPDSINTPELRVEMTDAELKTLMDEIIAQVDFPDANITMIDGIRADFENGWGLVRASNTTPSLIMRFEGKDKESMREVQDKFRSLILNINPGINLPF